MSTPDSPAVESLVSQFEDWEDRPEATRLAEMYAVAGELIALRERLATVEGERDEARAEAARFRTKLAASIADHAADLRKAMEEFAACIVEERAKTAELQAGSTSPSKSSTIPTILKPGSAAQPRPSGVKSRKYRRK